MATRVKNLFTPGRKSRPTSQVVEWNKADEKLLQSTKKGDLTRVQSCLKKGGDPIKIEPNQGITAFHEAACTGSTDVIDALLATGVEINARDGQGRTALHYAVTKGNTDAALTLLNKHADPSLVDGELRSAMHHACMGNMDCVVILLKFHSPCDLRDSIGRTPLSFAAENGQASVCKLFLENGANVNNRDQNFK